MSSAAHHPKCLCQGQFSTSQGTITPLAMPIMTREGGCQDISATLTKKVAVSHPTRAIGDSQESLRRMRTMTRRCRCWLNPRGTLRWAETTQTRNSHRLLRTTASWPEEKPFKTGSRRRCEKDPLDFPFHLHEHFTITFTISL